MGWGGGGVGTNLQLSQQVAHRVPLGLRGAWITAPIHGRMREGRWLREPGSPTRSASVSAAACCSRRPYFPHHHHKMPCFQTLEHAPGRPGACCRSRLAPPPPNALFSDSTPPSQADPDTRCDPGPVQVLKHTLVDGG